jgi:hypothetical protein
MSADFVVRSCFGEEIGLLRSVGYDLPGLRTPSERSKMRRNVLKKDNYNSVSSETKGKRGWGEDVERIDNILRFHDLDRGSPKHEYRGNSLHQIKAG